MKEVKKSIVKIAVVVLQFTGLQVLGVVLAAIICAIYGVSQGKTFSSMQGTVMSLGIFLGDLAAIWFFLSRRRTTIQWGAITRADRWPVCLLAMLLAVAWIIPDAFLMQWAAFDDYLEEDFKMMMNNPFGILSISVLAPLSEEIICRGIIMTILLKMLGKPWPAIIVSALLFGIIHLNPVQTVSATIIGIVLGWLYYCTGSLIPCILVHFVNNSIATALSLIYGYDATMTDMGLGIDMQVMLSACLMVLCAFLIFRLNLLFRHIQPLQIEEKSVVPEPVVAETDNNNMD